MSPQFSPTAEQLACVRAAGHGSLKIEAFAGASKTTTLTMIASAMDQRSVKGMYLAFNKEIAAEAERRFPRSVLCKTTHALAYAAMVRKYGGGEKMMGKANALALAQAVNIQPLQIAADRRALTSREVGALVQMTVGRFCQSAATTIGGEHVAREGVIDALTDAQYGYVQDVVAGYARRVWTRMTDPADSLPCGHDGYLKAWALTSPKFSVDYVALDEAQDSNGVILDVIAKSGATPIYVGDRHQQIYSFRGATNAMQSVDTETTLHLTQSFRFGSSIAAHAARTLRFLGEENVLRGNPQVRDSLRLLDRPNVKAFPGETVLTRTNSGLLGEFLKCLRANLTTTIIGGTAELKRQLLDAQALQRGEPARGAEFFGFSTWDEVVEYVEANKKSSGALATFVATVEEYGASELLTAVGKAAPVEADADVVLSTAHKSKGREWSNVRLAGDFNIYSDDESPASIGSDDEIRLFYVACTRAKQSLVLPESYVQAIELAEEFRREQAELSARESATTLEPQS